MTQRYAAAGVEPPLEELLNDPITRLVMRRDGIGLADVRRAVAVGRSGPRLSLPQLWQAPGDTESIPESPPDLAPDSPAA